MAIAAIVAGVASVAGSAISTYKAGQANQGLYKDRARTNEESARLIELQGGEDSLNRIKSFNNTMASNAVMAAAQGRSSGSGSIDAMAKESVSQYEWDRDYSELSTEYETRGADIAASDAKLAGIQAKQTAKLSMFTTALTGGSSLTKLMGSKE